MKGFSADKIRNIALLGHGSEGKTTLAEAMMFVSGATDRMGRVEDGTTVMDYDPEEIRRSISISTAMAPVVWKDTKINVIDVPGYFDFVGEMQGSLRVADMALIVVGATSGVTVGAEKAWKSCIKNHRARMFVVNQMDREHANYNKVLSQLQDTFGAAVVPVIVPIMQGETFVGLANVLDHKAYEVKGKTVKEIPVPEALATDLMMYKEQIMEAAAGSDETLMEAFFENGELTQEQLEIGMKKGLADGLVVPVACVASVQASGVPSLLDFLAQYGPSPLNHPAAVGKNPRNGQEETRACDSSAPFSAIIFKTVADPFVGKLSLVKILSGKLTSDMQLYNPTADRTEKVGTLYVMNGKKQIAADALMAGDIGALAKLQVTMTGHTLCDAAHPIVYPTIDYPKPSISMAVSAKKQGEEDKIFSGLYRLAEEDPSFNIGKNPATGEALISGQGELHIEVITRKLASKFGVEVNLADPRIPYRETIRKSIKAEGRHKKQSGGHGQFGHVWVEFEPILDSSVEFEFVDKVVGGVVPRQYIPAVEKGLRENLPRGIIAGYPLVNIRATLYDGSYHAVDSSEMAFKTAARLALKKCATLANPALLEPIYTVRVYVPDDYMGDVIGDMNRRRGRIMGMHPDPEGGQCVEAEVPLTEIFKYATDLRSLTQARGSFEMEFARYEEVPANVAQKIIDSATMEEEED